MGHLQGHLLAELIRPCSLASLFGPNIVTFECHIQSLPGDVLGVNRQNTRGLDGNWKPKESKGGTHRVLGIWLVE